MLRALLLLALSALLMLTASAAPWTKVIAPGLDIPGTRCDFSGDSDGAPLVRTGNCAKWNVYDVVLDLSNKGITSVPAHAFKDMPALK
jgi:hypothetical protein